MIKKNNNRKKNIDNKKHIVWRKGTQEHDKSQPAHETRTKHNFGRTLQKCTEMGFG